MKKINLIGALILSASLLQAQTNNKQVTVRVKKVENVNGVEKITDTTYITDNVSDIKTDDGAVNFMDWKDESGATKKIVMIKNCADSIDIILDNKIGRPLETVTISSIDEKTGQKIMKQIVINDPSNATEQKTTMILLNSEMKDVDEHLKMLDEKLNESNGKKDQAVVIEEDINVKEGENRKTTVYVIRAARIIDVSAEDKKLLEKQTGISDNKLALDQMKFYPNPNTGKFTLDFNLPEKGKTEVNILNIEGKSVYKEELKDFSGNYKREIDISSNPKGIYFVKVNQGKHAQLKKIILE